MNFLLIKDLQQKNNPKENNVFSIRMPTAIVLINTEIGKESEVIDSLSKLPEVKEIYLVYGVYDIVAKIDSETMESLEGIITQKIRHVRAIRSTLTLIVSRRGK